MSTESGDSAKIAELESLEINLTAGGDFGNSEKIKEKPVDEKFFRNSGVMNVSSTPKLMQVKALLTTYLSTNYFPRRMSVFDNNTASFF